MASYSSTMIVVGVDVGGPRKGFHAVALEDGVYLDMLHALDARLVAEWVRDLRACAVAVDAPCRWRQGDLARAAERELAKCGIHCFHTPTREKATKSSFYSWMLNGTRLYKELSAAFRLFEGVRTARGRHRLETFPMAISCALAGRKLSVRDKRSDRRKLVERRGMAPEVLRSMDFIDAALCAVAADSFARGSFKAFGDQRGGFIVVPESRGSHRDGATDSRRNP